MFAGKPLIFFLLALSFFSTQSLAQQKKSKAQLQKEKQQSLQKINEVEKILTQTAAQKKNSIGELNAVNERIREQENLIAGIRDELRFLDGEISENNDI